MTPWGPGCPGMLKTQRKPLGIFLRTLYSFRGGSSLE